MSEQMARLNEPAPAPETMESLKRKFMRQNRDIARANSTQSLRIRNLENETSRLLAENLGLREQIIKLRRELDEGKAQKIADHAIDLRSQLEAKLVELGSLISGLGNDAPKISSPKAGKTTRASLSKSPDQRNWRNMCTLSEAVSGQDGRLPAILENKTYPRRTLERQEIVNLIADAGLDTTDSPEIGPPPVSQFVDEDPVKIDLPRRSREGDNESSSLDPTLSANLEQRRKRRDTSIVVDLEQAQADNSEPSNASRETERSMKTGAKRKLSVRDDEEDVKSSVPPSPDNFKFTRVKEEDKSKSQAAGMQPEKQRNKSAREIAVPRGLSRERQSSSAISSRKALAPKSVNSSPRKKTNALAKEDKKPLKLDTNRPKYAEDAPKDINVATRVESQTDPIIQSVEIRPEPETPAATDIFSPLSSQPSTVRVESRDTPPPGDFGAGSDVQRPSRRVRGAVSYAEPNLRDKMRRPTKDLVDAVSREEKARRAGTKVEEDLDSIPVTIKSEPESDDAWKTMLTTSATTSENSPLRGKAPEIMPSSITTQRKRRESILNQTETDLPTSSSSSEAAVLAESRLVKGAKESLQMNENGLTKGLENLDIHDSKISPPPQVLAPEKVREGKPTLRFTRRHPSISRDVVGQGDSEASDMESSNKPDITTSRRRQSSLGLRNPTATAESKKIDSQKSLNRSSSAASISEVGQNESRSDRISARRRSMML